MVLGGAQGLLQHKALLPACMTDAVTAEPTVNLGGHMLEGKVVVWSACGGTYLMTYVLI